MAINKAAFKLAGVNYEQYKSWCMRTGRPLNSKLSKTEFFRRIREGKLAIDINDNLVNKRPRKK